MLYGCYDPVLRAALQEQAPNAKQHVKAGVQCFILSLEGYRGSLCVQLEGCGPIQSEAAPRPQTANSEPTLFSMHLNPKL